MKKTLFTMDAYPEHLSFEGFTFGERWNGWACPYFTKEQGLKLIDAQNELVNYCVKSGVPFFTLKFDEEKDAFIIGYFDSIDDEDAQFEDYEAVVREGVKLYAIGAYSWCWYELKTEGA